MKFAAVVLAIQSDIMASHWLAIRGCQAFAQHFSDHPQFKNFSSCE